MSNFKRTSSRRGIMFLLSLSFLVISFSSCVSNKKIIYLQNQEQSAALDDGQMINYDLLEYRLQFNDIIEIQVLTIEDLMKNGFSLSDQMPAMNMGMQMGQGGGDIYYMTGYSVDKDGNIRIPMLGNVKVTNLTIDEVRVLIEEQLRRYISSEFFVRVKLGGIRYSALGEFRKPGKYVVLQDRMTIFEAIAHAGDITPIGRREEVVLIRQFPEGSKIFKVNLLDRNIINSQFYFIQPNDQLYVEPLKVRELGAGENAAQSLTLIISTFTFVALVLNLLSN
ncbi:polysaccharide biosynthesis/export family protein [Mongoliibacter ruber]|uniref:Polysaccharide export outer membrane protein n=1 Tax=Mongoliibacter ruber TaxID=1750599 RepID=A0A2T0WNX8_9BACT|nr:polysaccharide biosynthesis/export family protein [Mongoliibacter ruber]PRY88392.1 polysaccharide export outer membrane protein [Mongoliibacter ruber]